jgi:hypothetical protein
MNVLLCTEIIMRKLEDEALTIPDEGKKQSALLIEAHPAATVHVACPYSTRV